MGIIKTTTDNLIEHNLYEYRESIKSAFEISVGTSKSKNVPGHISLTTSHGYKNKVWSELERVFSEDIYQICKQVKTQMQTFILLDLFGFVFNLSWLSLDNV